MTKRITAHLTIQLVPLPPEKFFAYREAMRMLLEPLFACKRDADNPSYPAQGESGEGSHAGLPVQIHPGAGVTTPSDSPYRAPAGITSLSLQAKTTAGDAG